MVFIDKHLVFIDINTYILTEDRNFKTFLKENYAIALNICYMFTKNMLVEHKIKHGVAKVYEVLRYIKHS